MFDESLEVAAFEVRVMRQGSDIAVVAFYWNEDGFMEVVAGCASAVAVEPVTELLVCAKQALDNANWKSVHIGNEAPTEPGYGEPPF